MRELRTQESKKFEKFFEIIRKEAVEENSIFFCDCGEGREFFKDDMEGEDLMGWLVPKNLADVFEPEWRSNNVGERWNSFVRFAIWREEKGEILISFQSF
ncbi:MAG TPA: hypothetical protein H9672_05775 [Firmicutes bacterium]|nr:hypothetical protein [Bacillota bacterium]